MPVHIGERREAGVIRPAFFLDHELALLSEGFCPFSVAHYPEKDWDRLDLPAVPLTITEDGWARCSWGDDYRYPAQPPVPDEQVHEWFRQHPNWGDAANASIHIGQRAVL